MVIATPEDEVNNAVPLLEVLDMFDISVLDAVTIKVKGKVTEDKDELTVITPPELTEKGCGEEG